MEQGGGSVMLWGYIASSGTGNLKLPGFNQNPGKKIPSNGTIIPSNLGLLKVKVLSAHDKGSHAEVEAEVQKVLSHNTKLKIQRGWVTLYPESWTTRGCTCPILNPGVEYLVAGHLDRKQGRLLVNMKSFVKPWKASLRRKVLTLLKKDCNW